MRILIAEDDPISRKVLESTLRKWDHDVVVTEDGAQALQALQADDAPRLAVLDWMMPEMDGPEVCRRVRQMPGGEYVYILLLTAKGNRDDIVEGLEAGADDYVIKPFDKRELRVRLRCGQRIVVLQNELLAAQDALRVQATHDSLTGLLNRAATFDRLQRETSRQERHDHPTAVVMVDLDHFKQVNDTHGHAAGDAVLVEAARRMGSHSRAYDVVGRYGGEEFLIILPVTGQEAARAQAERIREVLRREPVDLGDGRSLSVTASLGVASTDVLGNVSVEDLVKSADAALYDAKDSGRDRVCLASSVPSLTQ